MTRSIRVSHCHHHRNRRGSYGDGSFNEKYVSQQMLATRIQPLTRPLNRKVSDESEDDKNIFQQRRHTASTVASTLLKQPSLRSIGEMESFTEEDDDDMSLDLGDIANFHQKHSLPKNLHSSLRSIGVSIRSLPREIELLDEEEEDDMEVQDYDFSSILSGDDECLRAMEAPSMIELQSSLRSLEHSDIWFLPREKELLDDERSKHRLQRLESAPIKRVSFVEPNLDRSPSQFSQRIWQSWNACSEDLSELQQDLAEIRQKVVSMEALVATMSLKDHQMIYHPSPKHCDSPLEQQTTVPRAA